MVTKRQLRAGQIPNFYAGLASYLKRYGCAHPAGVADCPACLTKRSYMAAIDRAGLDIPVPKSYR